jgi:hypothetical protein
MKTWTVSKICSWSSRNSSSYNNLQILFHYSIFRNRHLKIHVFRGLALLLSSSAIVTASPTPDIGFNTDAGFTVPKDAVNGTYIAYWTLEGKQVHVPIVEANMTVTGPVYALKDILQQAREKEHQLAKLSDPYFCGCGFSMNHRDCDEAVASVKVKVEAKNVICGNSAVHTIYNSVVAFGCCCGGLCTLWNSGTY